MKIGSFVVRRGVDTPAVCEVKDIDGDRLYIEGFGSWGRVLYGGWVDASEFRQVDEEEMEAGGVQ